MLRTTAVRFWLPVLAVVLVGPGAIGAPAAAGDAGTEPPSCAVLVEATGAESAVAEALAVRAALLDVGLAEGGLVTPVERAGLGHVLREQQLAAAFGPEAGARRVELGRLTNAELLVFLRPAVPAVPAAAAPEGVPRPE